MGGYTMEPTAQENSSTEGLSPSTVRPSPRTVVPTPICRFENFLGAAAAEVLLSDAISRRADFIAGTVVDPLTGQVSHKGRDSLVLPTHSPIFSQQLADCLPLVSEVLGVDTELSASTTVLTAHGAESHFGIHTDLIKTSDRVVSAVYYMHRRPRGFDGGQLRLYDTAVRDGRAERAETYRVIEPDHDTIVFFPSSAFHEVAVSHCPSGQFADYRFTLTTWIS